MPEIFKRSIIRLLKHADYRPLKLSQLAKALGVSAEDYPQFKLAFDYLRDAGHVVIGTGSLITLPSITGRTVGTFRMNPKGFGFVTPLEPSAQGDLYIPVKAVGEAMTGDIVEAVVVKKGKRSGQMRYAGKIVEVLERAQNRFVGILLKRGDSWIVQPDGKAFTEPISVDDVTAKNAVERDKVVVEILSYPTSRHLAHGVITEVLGKAGRYDSEINSIIHQYHLPKEFDESCLSQARQAAGKFDSEHIDDRQDITDKVVITIDPPDAKDFDDAISLEKDSQGRWVLGVHIADVSHFVAPQTPLGIEARDRGNSVYLPGRTIPMLPEILSNGICSLQPEQKRFVKSVYLTYDAQGNVVARKFANSVMCSTQRLTYQQADRALKGHTKDVKPEVTELLKNMESLSRVIEQRRLDNEMLQLDIPEIKVIMDKAGRVVDACPADSSYPHTIIEMFMVEANEAVASLLDRLNVPFMRRIHPEPDSLTLKNLSRLIRTFGIALPKTPDRGTIQQLLASVKGADYSLAVNLVVLRSLEKAQYSTLQIGHFALASSHYCHFTSPIRRYADLLVHRMLDCYFAGSLKAAEEAQNLAREDLIETGRHITFAEKRAEDAERELKMVLILQMLSSRTGQELDCVVTGIAGFGVFVRSNKFGVDGLIKIDDLGPDKWRYDQKTQSMVGLRTGCRIRLGQPLKVRILSVNVPARQLNLAPAEPLIDIKRKTKKNKTIKGIK